MTKPTDRNTTGSWTAGTPNTAGKTTIDATKTGNFQKTDKKISSPGADASKKFGTSNLNNRLPKGGVNKLDTKK